MDLAAAVDEVIDAAGQEFEPEWQRKLLSVRTFPLRSFIIPHNFACASQTANFGKSFLDLYNANDFVNMGKTLKVLNAVRQFEVGIPITHYQCV